VRTTAVIVAMLALAVCAALLGCGGRTSDSHGDGCADCSGTTPTPPPADAGNSVTVDATTDGSLADEPNDAAADAIDATIGPPAACAGGCACFSTPDACTASQCTPRSFVEPDGATGFACANLPLGFVCEHNGGRCLGAGARCPNYGSPNDCDPWPSAGAFCCLDQPDAGTNAADASDQDADAATTDAGDADAHGCVCSMAYGPCGALNPCGCCNVSRLTCGPGYCLYAP
jgi:hypothetical protein